MAQSHNGKLGIILKHFVRCEQSTFSLLATTSAVSAESALKNRHSLKMNE